MQFFCSELVANRDVDCVVSYYSVRVVGMFLTIVFVCTAAAAAKTSATERLLTAAAAGNLTDVNAALAAGANTSAQNSDGATAREVAKGKTPWQPWKENEFSAVRDAIAAHEVAVAQGRREMADADAADQLAALLDGPAQELLFYAVGSVRGGTSDGTCNATMAKLALERVPPPNVHATDANGRTAREVAQSKRKKGKWPLDWSRWSEDDCETVVELLDRTAAAVDAQAKREANELQYPSIKLLHETLSNLNFVGIAALEAGIERVMRSFKAGERRNPYRCDSDGSFNEAWVLTGNPGTGKTTIARELAPVLHAAGMVSKPDFFEVKKADMKGTHVGQTAKQVTDFFALARGHVVFVDEAYTYTKEDQYEKVILEEMLSELTRVTTCKDRKIFIFAGYKKELQEWMQFNPGFERRMKNRFHIPDFGCETLAAIFLQKLAQKQLLTLDAHESEYVGVLASLLEDATTAQQRTKNGGSVSAKLAELVSEIHTEANLPEDVVSQEMVCDAIRRLSAEKLGGGHFDTHHDLVCPEVPPHPELDEAVALTKAGLGRSALKRQKQKERKKRLQEATAAAASSRGGGEAVVEAAPDATNVVDYAWSMVTRVMLWYAAASWMVQIMLYVAVYTALGASVASVVIAVVRLMVYVFRALLWLLKQLWHMLKQLWNALMDCCGKKGSKFEDAPDPNASAFEQARDAAAKPYGGGVEEAMAILWRRAPREVALHGEQIRSNLEVWREMQLEVGVGGGGSRLPPQLSPASKKDL